MVVLPQLGDELSSLELDLGVGGQVVGRRVLSDHNIGLDVQVPVDPGNTGQSNQHERQMLTEGACQCVAPSTHTAGLYGAGAGLGVVGVAGGACLSSGAELQGLTTGVLGEIGVVGSTWGNNTEESVSQ